MTPNQDVQTYLATAATSAFYQQEVALLDAWEGSENLLWRVQCSGQEAVLKLYLDAGQARSRRQYDGHQLFAGQGLAPRPLWFDRYPEGLSRQVLVYEWVYGTPINSQNEQELLALAQTVAQVHGGDPNEVRRFSPNPVNLDYYWRVQQGSFRPIEAWLNQQNGEQFVAHFLHLAERSQALVQAALPLWGQTPPSPVHGDLTLENCISSFGTAVLLDWELFGIGDPALDVASFLHNTQQTMDEASQSHWLDCYLEHFEQIGLTQRIGVYQRLLPLKSLCFLLDGMRSAGADLFADVETVAFLRATLAATLDASVQALGVETVDSQAATEELHFTH